jgi:hypothetical protein
VNTRHSKTQENSQTGSNNITYSVCSLGSQYICFNPIYPPGEQWLEFQSFTSTGELISQTQVYNPERPLSMDFDVCVIIAKNSVYWTQDIGNTCRGLAWEKTYTSNDKHMCQRDICSHNDAVKIQNPRSRLCFLTQKRVQALKRGMWQEGREGEGR